MLIVSVGKYSACTFKMAAMSFLRHYTAAATYMGATSGSDARYAHTSTLVIRKYVCMYTLTMADDAYTAYRQYLCTSMQGVCFREL